MSWVVWLSMSKLVLVLLVLVAVIILIMIIGLAALWLKGGTSIALPSLGIVVSGGIVLCFLILAEITIVAIAAYLARYNLL